MASPAKRTNSKTFEAMDNNLAFIEHISISKQTTSMLSIEVSISLWQKCGFRAVVVCDNCEYLGDS